jgi:hypothetical protein
MTLSRMTVSITNQIVILKKHSYYCAEYGSAERHFDESHYAEVGHAGCRYALCHSAERRGTINLFSAPKKKYETISKQTL